MPKVSNALAIGDCCGDSPTYSQYPTVTVVSQCGGGQTETGKVFVSPSTETFAHDADGNLTADGRWTYSWDAENRLVQMIRDSDSPTGARQKLVFEYDHQGRRIRKQFFSYSAGWQEQADTIFLVEWGWVWGHLKRHSRSCWGLVRVSE